MSDLVSHAHTTRVVVVGGGLAGLVAALECARLGFGVTVVEAGERFGGALGRADLAGIAVDTAPDAVPGSAATITALIEDAGLTADLVRPRNDRTWLVGPNGAAPAPADTVLGIPANPWAEDVRRHIDARGSWRAYLDRLRPPLTVGHRRSLGELVSTRMGERVRDRLVAPYSLGVHGVAPEFIDVDVAASGLNAALTRAGSLGGAVAQSLPTAERYRLSLRGGMHRLVDGLVERLGDYAVALHPGTRVDAVERDGEGWIVRLDEPLRAAHAGAHDDDEAADAPTAAPVPAADVLHADLLIVATGEAPARRLLAPHLEIPATAAPHLEPLEAVLLRLRGISLPDRGSLIIGSGPQPATVRPVSATWAWLHETLPAGDHILRVTVPVLDRDAGDAEVVRAAREAASALLDVDLSIADVIASHRETYVREAPSTVLGHADAVRDIRDRLRAEPGLAVVGAWLAGTGLERVAADAVAEADLARRRALWGGVEPA